MSEETVIHDCKACGVRQRVDELEKTDKQAAIRIVVDVCTKCSDHPKSEIIRSVAEYVGIELESRWQPRVDE